MSQQNCIVLPLLETFSKDDLCSPNGSLHEVFLKRITRCKCPEHITENPVELPTISELNNHLVVILSELLEWGMDHIHEDTTGTTRALVAFIQNNCLAESPHAILSIIDNLEKIYKNPPMITEQ